MKLLDKTRLKKLLQQLKQKDVFGYKKVVDENDILRQQLLMEIDYDKELAFDVNQIAGKVGQFGYSTFENFILT